MEQRRQRVEFEWAISDPNEDNLVHVRERLCGSDLMHIFGPLPRNLAASFIKARRSFVQRTLTTRAKAIKIFEPNYPLINLTSQRRNK